MSRDARAERQLGRSVAMVLAGAWRAEPPPLAGSSDLSAAAPLLLRSGAAGLAWWRFSSSELPVDAVALELYGVSRAQAQRAAALERRVEQVFVELAKAGVTAVLGKGWAAVRLYPQPGMRCPGDIDLYVPAEQHEHARAVIDATGPRDGLVDLHRGFADLADRPAAEIVARARTVRLGDADVRVYGPEDHLRLLALHLLRHGAWRPLWLCDVAAALEEAPADFEPAWFLVGEPRRAEWALAALRLAGELLGARDARGLAGDAPPLPAWLPATVLRQWGRKDLNPQGLRVPFARHRRTPAVVWRALLERWPDPVEATVGCGASFDSRAQWPLQLRECARRIRDYVRPPHPVGVSIR